MAFEVYKPGQATLTRWAAFAGIEVIVLYGALRFYATFTRPGDAPIGGIEKVPILGVPLTWAVLAGLVIAAAGSLATFHVLNRPKVADLLIDTESELKKVSWPTRDEAVNACVVVCITVAVFALVLTFFDQALDRFFHLFF